MNHIRDARLAKGLTMKELGALVGVSEGAISFYELEKRQAGYDTLLKIGKALDVSVAYLLGENHDGPEAIPSEKILLLKEIDKMSIDEMARLLRIIEALK